MANGDSPQDKFHSPEGEWLFAILTKLFRQMANGDSPWRIKGFASFEKQTWPLSLISSHIYDYFPKTAQQILIIFSIKFSDIVRN